MFFFLLLLLFLLMEEGAMSTLRSYLFFTIQVENVSVLSALFFGYVLCAVDLFIIFISFYSSPLEENKSILSFVLAI